MQFFDNVLSAATQVGVLYVIVAIGFICDKTGFFTEKTARATVNLLLYIVTPCTLINSFIKIEMNQDTVRKFFISFAVATATHLIAILINKPLFRNKADEDNAVYKFASIYGNVGFMALPLAQAVLGDEGVFYCANGVVIYNIICFTHGVALMNKGKEKFNILKLIFNPGVISVIIGLPIFLLSIEVPKVLSQPVEMMANLNTPVAMLIFGTYLANTDLKSMFKKREFIKLL
ncbi:MAG: AEC family transporter [Clostridia bacterium]|nr:AEC family transporter [Clostridia bacterium]